MTLAVQFEQKWLASAFPPITRWVNHSDIWRALDEWWREKKKTTVNPVFGSVGIPLRIEWRCSAMRCQLLHQHCRESRSVVAFPYSLKAIKCTIFNSDNYPQTPKTFDKKKKEKKIRFEMWLLARLELITVSATNANPILGWKRLFSPAFQRFSKE